MTKEELRGITVNVSNDGSLIEVTMPGATEPSVIRAPSNISSKDYWRRLGRLFEDLALWCKASAEDGD